MKCVYVTPTNVEFYDAIREDAAEGETNWTVSKHVGRGDLIPLYVCAPVSAIVAVGEASADAELCDDPSNEWFGHYFVDIHGLRMLAEPVTRATLMRELPSWGWPKQPRNCARVPEQFAARLLELIR